MNIFTPAPEKSGEYLYQQQINEFKQSNLSSLEFAIEFDYLAYYLEQTSQQRLSLCAVFSCHKRFDAGIDAINTYCSVFKVTDKSSDSLQQLNRVTTPAHMAATINYSTQPRKALINQLKQFNAPLLNINQALFLHPVSIEKPWGKEIWFTGIEARGQSQLTQNSQCDSSIPLPWLLDLLPVHFGLSFNQSPILLKTLDPIADEVFGDLYFEMHQQKQEIYVVTAIDKSAWPEGVGKMRFGFKQNKIATFDTLINFKVSFQSAVDQYKCCRDEIDQLLDVKKSEANIALNQAVDLELMKYWLTLLPESLIIKEKQLRADVETYIGLKPVRVGDVIKIPFNTPHSLMHGIRTIEFQTPVYERKIICFWQKVLTQGHWDTKDALQLLDFNQPPPNDFEVLTDSENHSVDRIVDYPQFEVLRYNLQGLARVSLPMIEGYGLITCVTNTVQIDNLTLEAEQSCMVTSKHNSGRELINLNTTSAICLLALPKY